MSNVSSAMNSEDCRHFSRSLPTSRLVIKGNCLINPKEVGTISWIYHTTYVYECCSVTEAHLYTYILRFTTKLRMEKMCIIS